jgi:peptidyl-prolyl cis-trans isomerase SurA
MTRGRLLTIFLAAALTLVIALPAYAVTLDRIVAVVNKEAITWLQLHHEMEKELGGTAKDMPAQQKRDLLLGQEQAFLETLVMKKLQLHESYRLGLGANEQDADVAIENIRAKYNLSLDEFREALGAQGIDWDIYRSSLIEQIAISRVIDRSVRSKVQQQILAEPIVDDGSIEYVFRQIYLSGDMESTSGTMDLIKSSLESGVTFEALTRRFSDDPSAAEGGTVGPIAGNVLSPEFRYALASLSAGQISRPFVSKRGVHIIELLESKTTKSLREEEIFQSVYVLWLQDLKENAFIDIRLEAATSASLLTPSARPAPRQTKIKRRRIADDEGGGALQMGEH